MNVYVILFRGVGGKTQLPTKPLREALRAAGFANVATYINSGNAALASDKPRDEVIEVIARICSREFGFDKAIYAITRAEWDKVVANNPFPNVQVGNQLHAAILDGAPPLGAVDHLRALAVDGEDIKVIGQAAYLHTPNGFGRSRMAEKFDKGIGVANTARNWNTVVKLAEMVAAVDAT